MYQLVCTCIMLGYQQAQDRVGSWFLAIIYLSESPASQNPYVLVRCLRSASAVPEHCHIDAVTCCTSCRRSQSTYAPHTQIILAWRSSMRYTAHCPQQSLLCEHSRAPQHTTDRALPAPPSAVLGAPLSWVMWYRRLYDAAKSNGSLTYFWFFLFFMVHIAFCCWAAVGESPGGLCCCCTTSLKLLRKCVQAQLGTVASAQQHDPVMIVCNLHTLTMQQPLLHAPSSPLPQSHMH